MGFAAFLLFRNPIYLSTWTWQTKISLQKYNITTSIAEGIDRQIKLTTYTIHRIYETCKKLSKSNELSRLLKARTDEASHTLSSLKLLHTSTLRLVACSHGRRGRDKTVLSAVWTSHNETERPTIYTTILFLQFQMMSTASNKVTGVDVLHIEIARTQLLSRLSDDDIIAVANLRKQCCWWHWSSALFHFVYTIWPLLSKTGTIITVIS